jgi:predicted dehydrogenase
MAAEAGQLAFGLVGCGRVVRELHLPAWQMVRKARLVSACDPDPNALAAIKTHYPSARLNRRFDDFLAGVRSLDFVVLATPGFTHAEMGEQILESGVHLLCEKPLALSLDSARRLYVLAEQQRRMLTAMHNYRLKDNTLRATNPATRRALGDIASVTVRFRSGSLFDEAAGWMIDERSYRVLLFEMTYHFVDIAMLFLGPLRQLRFADAELDSLGINYSTFGTLHESGARGLFELVLDASSKSTCIDVVGENGALSLEFYPEGFRLLPRRDTPQARCLADARRIIEYSLAAFRHGLFKTPPKRIVSHARIFAAFVDAVANDGPNPVAPESVMRTIELLDAVAQQVYLKKEPLSSNGSSACDASEMKNCAF